MSAKGEMYKSKAAKMKHEMKEGSKLQMMEDGKQKPKAKAKKQK